MIKVCCDCFINSWIKTKLFLTEQINYVCLLVQEFHYSFSQFWSYATWEELCPCKVSLFLCVNKRCGGAFARMP